MFRIGIFESDRPLQIGGVRQKRKSKLTSVGTVLYVMLEVPTSYQSDINRLTREFKSRYGHQIIREYDFSKPDPKHITIAQADLSLTDSDIKKFTQNWRHPITLSDIFQDQSGKLFDRLMNQIETELNDFLTDVLISQFQDLPKDTTASCYPSRFNIYGKFIVVQYKPDLGFHALLVPAIKHGLEVFFHGRGKIQMGRFYQDPKDVMLHISLARERPNARPPKSMMKAIQSKDRGNFIRAGLAKNFTISREILKSFKNPVWVSLGSYGTFA